MRHLVVDLMSNVPHMRLPDAVADQVKASCLPGWRMTVVQSPTVSGGDGTNTVSAETLAAVADAEAYYGFGAPPAMLEAAPAMRWVHSAAAGVGASITPVLRRRVAASAPLVFTNSAGLYGEPMADTIVAGVLHFVRGLDAAVRLQAESRWVQRVFAEGETEARELDDYRVLVVGAGGIGSAVARRFSALGLHCTGVRRRPEQGLPPGFAAVVGPAGLDDALTRADILVIAAPATADTQLLLDARRVALLPAGAIVVNVARGGLVEDEPLRAALDAGRLRGAVLDVFHTEPLPVESPWWQHPRVLITPHVSGVSPRRYWARALELFTDNWRRFAAGEPLRNVVDLDAGY